MNPTQEINNQNQLEPTASSSESATVTPLYASSPPPTSQSKTKWRKILIVLVNVVPVTLTVIFMLWAYSLQNSGVSGTEYLAFIVLPVLSILFLIAFIVDLVFLIKFLRRSRHNPQISRVKKTLAFVAVAAIVGIIVINIVATIWAAWDSQRIEDQTYKDQQSEFQRNYELTARSSEFKFEILVPEYLPSGYKYSYGQISGASNSPESIYFEASFYSSDHDFSLRTFNPRENFIPPEDCGYPLSPPMLNNPDTQKAFPCEELAQISSGKVYYLRTQESDLGFSPVQDHYYTVNDGTLLILTLVSGPQVLDSDEVVKILNSVRPMTVPDIVQLNIDSL